MNFLIPKIVNNIRVLVPTPALQTQAERREFLHLISTRGAELISDKVSQASNFLTGGERLHFSVAVDETVTYTVPNLVSPNPIRTLLSRLSGFPGYW